MNNLSIVMTSTGKKSIQSLISQFETQEKTHESHRQSRSFGLKITLLPQPDISEYLTKTNIKDIKLSSPATADASTFLKDRSRDSKLLELENTIQSRRKSHLSQTAGDNKKSLESDGRSFVTANSGSKRNEAVSLKDDISERFFTQNPAINTDESVHQNLPPDSVRSSVNREPGYPLPDVDPGLIKYRDSTIPETNGNNNIIGRPQDLPTENVQDALENVLGNDNTKASSKQENVMPNASSTPENVLPNASENATVFPDREQNNKYMLPAIQSCSNHPSTNLSTESRPSHPDEEMDKVEHFEVKDEGEHSEAEEEGNEKVESSTATDIYVRQPAALPKNTFDNNCIDGDRTIDANPPLKLVQNELTVEGTGPDAGSPHSALNEGAARDNKIVTSAAQKSLMNVSSKRSMLLDSSPITTMSLDSGGKENATPNAFSYMSTPSTVANDIFDSVSQDESICGTPLEELKAEEGKGSGHPPIPEEGQQPLSLSQPFPLMPAINFNHSRTKRKSIRDYEESVRKNKQIFMQNVSNASFEAERAYKLLTRLEDTIQDDGEKKPPKAKVPMLPGANKPGEAISLKQKIARELKRANTFGFGHRSKSRSSPATPRAPPIITMPNYSLRSPPVISTPKMSPIMRSNLSFRNLEFMGSNSEFIPTRAAPSPGRKLMIAATPRTRPLPGVSWHQMENFTDEKNQANFLAKFEDYVIAAFES